MKCKGAQLTEREHREWCARGPGTGESGERTVPGHRCQLEDEEVGDPMQRVAITVDSDVLPYFAVFNVFAQIFEGKIRLHIIHEYNDYTPRG